MFRSDCCLCSQIEGLEDNDLIARLLPGVTYVRRILLETSSFAVMPSLGALLPGHSIVCPKAHARSFSQLGSKKWAEFLQLKAVLASALRRLYGSSVHVFEHGMSVDGRRVPCTVDHAHMHFVPIPDSFDIDAVAKLKWIRIDGSCEAILQAANGSEYIFYEDSKGVARVLLPAEKEFESQYMRKLIASGVPNSGNWNWRDAPDAASADAAWRLFIAYLGLRS